MTDKAKFATAAALLALAVIIALYSLRPTRPASAVTTGPTVDIVCKACGQTSHTPWDQLAPLLKAPKPRTGMQVPCPNCGKLARLQVKE